MKIIVKRVAPASIAWRMGVLFAMQPSTNAVGPRAGMSIVTGGKAPGTAAEAQIVSMKLSAVIG